MVLTIEEKAMIILEMLNKDKPHGMSAKEWNKKYPDLNRKALGGLDYTLNFGNRQQYPLTPMTDLPFNMNENASTALGVIATDADIVNTVSPSAEYLSKQMKKKTKKMKSGFIHEADPSAPIVQENAYVKPSNKTAKAEIPVERSPEHKTLILRKDVKPMKVNTKGGKSRKKRIISEERKKNMDKQLSSWRNFTKMISKQPFMKNIKKDKMKAGSLVFELKKECEMCCPDFDTDEIISVLNEQLNGGSSGYEIYGINDVITMLNKMRKRLVENGAKIPMESMKAKEMQKKLKLV